MAIEVKVKGSAVGTLVASAALALLNALAANSALLGSLHPAVQFVVITLLPVVISFLSGYVTPSKTSRVSDSFNV